MRHKPKTTSLGTRKHSRKSQIIDLKKSFSLLHAYGEYGRFLEMSKHYMKEHGIVIKKNSSDGVSNGKRKIKTAKSHRFA